IQTTYYRWYKTGDENPNGFNNALKFVVRMASYDRMMAGEDLEDPDDATDDQVSTYADFAFEYDSAHRVSRQKIQGAGCSACSGGIGDYTYAYTLASDGHSWPDGYNHWATETVETLADANQNVVYSNAFGQVMVFAYREASTGRQWVTHYVYD